MAALSSFVCTGGIIITLFAAAGVVIGVPARFLVWSVVGHLGLFMTGIGLAARAGAEQGAQAAVLYAASLALAQALAWLAWRAMRGAAKSWDFSPARGMGRKMPRAAWAFTVGALGLAGLPPSPGFFARIMLFAAGFHVAGSSGYGAVVACSLQSLAWLLVSLHAVAAVWLGPPPTRPIRPPAQAALVAFAALGAVLAMLGIVPSPLLLAGERLAHFLGV